MLRLRSATLGGHNRQCAAAMSASGKPQWHMAWCGEVSGRAEEVVGIVGGWIRLWQMMRFFLMVGAPIGSLQYRCCFVNDNVPRVGSPKDTPSFGLFFH